ncbi:MAG TPA: hypothetical protein VM074_04150 [Solimonas sp.]|nr:hypothetical protein [Solimonas sp.]
MKLIALCAAAALTFGAATASAEDYREGIDDSPSAGAMAVDLLIIRPVGIVATVAGVGLFILNLPLSLIQGEPPTEAARKLIVEPARYTFQRPLGEMN